MRSLQFRLPLLAVGVLAISLAFSALVMFETLLLTGERRLDDSVERETLRIREAIAVRLPSALEASTASPPTAAELTAMIAGYLDVQDRSDETMTIVRIGDSLLSTADAPTALELLRDRGELPAFAEDRAGGLDTVASSQGDIRVASLPLRVEDGEATIMVAGSLEDVRSIAVSALGRISAAAGIGLVVAGVLLVFSIRRLLRPLNALATAARAAELEQLGTRVNLRNSTDEVGQLANEFNRMLDRLEGSVNDQRHFMAAVSHELRTPITIARGHLELLEGLDQRDDDGLVQEVVELVRAELMIMQRLVADLMTLGRAADDDFLVIEDVRLREFFDDLHLRVVGLGTRHVRFEPVADEVVAFDADRVAQAVLNLVTNASIHAIDHTKIVISAHAASTMFTVSVEDDGAGVQERLLGSLFEPFVRSETAHGSTGLGLSVVKAVADAHGGTVEFTTSQQGTTVRLQIPRNPIGSATPAQVHLSTTAT